MSDHVQQDYLHVFVAKHDFSATRDDEISLQAGDVVTEVVEDSQDWWQGQVRNSKGVFPASFLERVTRTGVCTVLFPFKPGQDDEIELELGQEVVMYGEVEEGVWGRGRSGDRMGCFPLAYVRQHKEQTPGSPVTLRRKSKAANRDKIVRHSLGPSIPVSGNLFDPEDEPLGPMFGSISSRMEEENSIEYGNEDKP